MITINNHTYSAKLYMRLPQELCVSLCDVKIWHYFPTHIYDFYSLRPNIFLLHHWNNHFFILACILAKIKLQFKTYKYLGIWEDGGGVGRGEHFLPHKFIKRAFKHRVNSTKQLLNAGRGHQAPRKATQLFERR